VSDFELDETELRAARSAARRMSRIARGLLTTEDLFHDLVVYLLINTKKVQYWRDMEKAGNRFRYRALCSVAQKIIVSERMARTGCREDDFAWYTAEMIKDILPMVWSYDDWTHAPSDAPEGNNRGTSRPAEGNTRLAMLSDVAHAVRKLTVDEQTILRNAFEDGGLDMEVLAQLLGVTTDGARKKVASIVRKIQDKLGGEPPVWVRRTGEKRGGKDHANQD
jgi:hypothetical protein